MSKTTDGPIDPSIPRLRTVRDSDIQPTDFKKLAAIIPGAIRFQVTYLTGVKDIYDLPLDRCRDYKEILGWAHHLSNKSWVEPGLLRYFISLACEANGIKFPSI
jgi:hypothetical protein